MTESSDQTNPGRTVVTQMSAVYPELAGKVAVVTGAAQGMGATFAEGLATRGIHVVGADINEEQMLATAARINTDLESNALADKPGRVVGARVDVTKPDEHELLAQLALKEFGRVDFWINNAGIFPFALAEEITPEQIGATLSVNVEGVLYGAQAAARHLGPAAPSSTCLRCLRCVCGRGEAHTARRKLPLRTSRSLSQWSSATRVFGSTPLHPATSTRR